MSASPKEEFNKLSFYTLAHADKNYFIHQHIVDAFQAQTADVNTKRIGLVFSLIGLYLYLEKGHTGKQVQLCHMKLAQNKKEWPQPGLPVHRGEITISDVLKSEAGRPRDKTIRDWCSSVWNSYKDWHHLIATLAAKELDVH